MKIYARTIIDFLDNSSELFPNKIALIFEKEKYTYRQIREQSDRLASFLSSKIKRKEIVALLLSNRPSFIVSYFAIFKAGGVVLLLEQGISDDNLRYRILKTDVKIIVSERRYREKILRSKLPKTVEFLDIDKIDLRGDRFKSVKISPNDASTIIYTSGTTSEPKAARLRHYNVVEATKNIVDFLKINKNDIDVNISSLSHSFGLGHVHCTFACGATTILFRNSINMNLIMESIFKYRASMFSATPTILRFLAFHFRKKFRNYGNHLRVIQTNISPLEPKLIKAILALLPNVKFAYYYGLSEASRSTFLTFNKNLRKIGSVGKPMPNVKIKIVDKKGKKVTVGNSGEICIKGKIVIKDYYKNNKANRQIKNGWLHTGDFGYLDRDGFLFFQSRRDDIINVSGEKVSPEEVEECIKTIPGVMDAAVVGISDKFLGEIVKAYVQVENQNFSTNQVLEICREKLETYKIPRAVEIINEIPRTDNGKLRRNILRSYNEN